MVVRKLKYNIICKNCNEEFGTNTKDKKFCSKQCYFDSKKQKMIDKKCKTCGDIFTIAESQSHKYSTCSKGCSLEYQRKLADLKSKKVIYICEYCEKEYKVKESVHKDNIRNSRFCSMKCRNKWESENKRGENHHNYGLVYPPEKVEKMRITTVKLYEQGIYDKQTKPQKVANILLDDLKINYQNEHGFKYYLMDNYLIDFNLGIEVMGDYFHSNPKYQDSLSDMQLRNISRDKRKRTYVRRYGKFDILYLWKSDLNNNPDLCRELISKYIDNNGILDDYNSFNYSLSKNILTLNNNIIIPYINLPKNKINKFAKDKNI